MTATEGISLELDDIQSGALHERPSPYVGIYLLLRIDDRSAGLAQGRQPSSTRDRRAPGSPTTDDAATRR